jgi:hypothetical protein
VTGDQFLNEGAQLALLAQATRAVFRCADDRCPHSLTSWEAELPAVANPATTDLADKRRWPKCPNKHRARFLIALDGGDDL